MLLTTLSVLALLNGNDAGLLSRLIRRASIASQISQPVISIVSCDNNSSDHQQPHYHSVSGIGSKYLQPTILNYETLLKPYNPQQEDENNIDINRIFPPISTQFSYRPVWIPNRLSIPNKPNSGQSPQNFISTDQTNKMIQVDKSVKFYLFTKKNIVKAQELEINMRRLNESNFFAEIDTKVIIHGFTDVDPAGEWVNVIKEAYLSVSNVNLIVADFSSFSIHSLLRSPSLAVFSSKKLSEFLTFLQHQGNVTLASFHVIARSYGCHIAGMSGGMLEGRLGRITGLEPSANIPLGGSQDFKLVKGNAKFVEVIHVNGKRFFFHGPQFGLVPPMGDVDVYPNIVEKGLGCPAENLNFRRYNLRFCHLGRGVRYWTYSVKYPRSYKMCKCSSFEIYEAGFCSCSQSLGTVYMGELLSNETHGVFQLAP